MPRQPRLQLKDVDWHIIGRGNRRQDIFEEECDWERFWNSLLAELAAEGVLVIALCLMTNHYHTVLEGEMEAISRAMHRAQTSHAAYMNKKYGRTGHLFEDRFKSYPCDPELGLKPLVRYVHRNPVRAGLVREPEQWRWSTHNEYLAPDSAAPSGRGLLLGRFGTDERRAREAYREDMKASPRPTAARRGDKVPLAVLAAHFEREGGHRPGLIKERSKRRDLLGLRQRFIAAAQEEGYSVGQIAAFLCVSPSAIFYRKTQGCGTTN